MSLEKLRHEAERWLQQARADLKAAEQSRTSGSFEWACFQAQQAAEKALKALWLSLAQEPWGHSLLNLIRELPDDAARSALSGLIDHAKRLDKLYIPTRYPNGLPDSIPADVYTDSEASEATVMARQIVEAVASLMG